MPDPRDWKTSRHHRRRRVVRWLRALGPLLLLLAAGLLSAGVVRVIEVTTPQRGLAPDGSGSHATPPRGRIDFEAFDDGLYHELQELDRSEPDDLSLEPGSHSVRELDLLRASLATSLLGRRVYDAISPFRPEIRASSLFEGPSDEGIESQAPLSSTWQVGPVMSEPGTTLLIATGFGALVRRLSPFT